MYTVIRFVAGPRCSTEEIVRVGTVLNQSLPGSYKRLDRIGGRFSITISSADNWGAHEEALGIFLRTAVQAIVYARSLDVVAEVDVAIEPEDILKAAYLFISISSQLLEEMARQNVGLGFTISNPAA